MANPSPSTHKRKPDRAFYQLPEFVIILLLIVATLTVFWQLQDHQFINYDDNKIIVNSYIEQGLTKDNVIWAFSFHSAEAGYWKPLTLISFMLSSQLFGMDAGWFLIFNLLLHIANTCLLFMVLRKMTGHIYRCAFVAALFAIHPIHVESVAWAVERKDVLSTFFMLLAILSYLWYLDRPRIRRYVAIMVTFALGLMSKPMIVTLPFALLLLDYWPLARISLDDLSRSAILNPLTLTKTPLYHIITEKIQLFILSAGSIYMTLQRTPVAHNKIIKHTIVTVRDAPLTFMERLFNALSTYISYIWKTIWPQKLGIPYPYVEVPLLHALGALVLLVLITLWAIKTVRTHPYFLVGWLFYLGTLVPTIGLVGFSFGAFAMGDRFTYIPLIGIFILVTWGIYDVVPPWRHKHKILATVAIVTLAICMQRAWVQTGYWKNSSTLFQHTLEVTPRNSVAHYNLACAAGELGQTAKAIDHFKQTLQIAPYSYEAHNNLGLLLFKKGDVDAALKHFNQALQVCPYEAQYYNNYGFGLMFKKQFKAAVPYFLKATKLDPTFFRAYFNLGDALRAQHKYTEAANVYQDILKKLPYNVHAQKKLAAIKVDESQMRLAFEKMRARLETDPDHLALLVDSGDLYKKYGRLEKALNQYQKALAQHPHDQTALQRLAYVHYAMGNYPRAIDRFKEIVTHYPDQKESYYNLACLFALQKKVDLSVAWLKQAIDRGYNDWHKITHDKDLAAIRKSDAYRNLLQQTPQHDG